MAICNRGRCCCGKEIVFRTIHGRVVPIHIE